MNIQCRSKRRTGARRPRRPTTGGRTVSARRPTTGGRTVSARRPLRTNSFSRHRSVPRMHRPRAPSTVGGGQCVFLQILVHKSYRPPRPYERCVGVIIREVPPILPSLAVFAEYPAQTFKACGGGGGGRGRGGGGKVHSCRV